MFENFSEYFEQIKRAIISFNTLGDLLDVLLVAFVIDSGIKLIRETRAIQLAKGVILLAVVYFFVSRYNNAENENEKRKSKCLILIIHFGIWLENFAILSF